MKLYEIAKQYQDALEYANDPEKFMQMVDTLDSIDENLKDKLESVGRIRQNKLAEAKALEEEAERLKERADKVKKEVGSLEKWVEYTLANANMKKIESHSFKFSFRKSTSLVVTDPEQIPEHFLKPQPPKVDVAGMKSHLKKYYEEKGLDIPEELPELGVKYETKENLQIK